MKFSNQCLAMAFLLAGCQSTDAKPTGSSATIEGVTYNVSPRIAARIQAIHVQEGNTVKAGQVLVDLECADPDAAVLGATAGLRAAQARVDQAVAQRTAALKGVNIASLRTAAAGANVNAAKSQTSVLDAQIANAERMVERLERLRAGGGGTAKQLDDAKTSLAVLQQQRASIDANTQAAIASRRATAGGEATAESQVSLADAGVAMAQADVERAKAALDQAKWLQSGCQLTAPADGTVQLRAFEPGEFVGPGTRVLRVVNTATVTATFYLSNKDLDLAAPGTKVQVVADAIDGKTFPGVVQTVSESAEFTPRSIQTSDDRQRLVYAVKAEIPNQNKELHPGMPVEVRVEKSK